MKFRKYSQFAPFLPPATRSVSPTRRISHVTPATRRGKGNRQGDRDYCKPKIMFVTSHSLNQPIGEWILERARNGLPDLEMTSTGYFISPCEGVEFRRSPRQPTQSAEFCRTRLRKFKYFTDIRTRHELSLIRSVKVEFSL